VLPVGHVLVGRVGKPHGLKGDVFVLPETDHPGRFSGGADVYLDGVLRPVASSRMQDNRLVVRFESVPDRSAAEGIRGAVVTIPESERRSLDDDEWWPDHLVGLRVYDHDGSDRGVIADVIEGVAQHRLVVDTGSGSVEIPFVGALVPVVDIEGGRVELADVDGLLTTD
jgi:16S rRNA processing protein RimM